jgi:hypothetical protein
MIPGMKRRLGMMISLLVVGAAGFFVWRLPPERSIYGVAAAGPDEAILLTRHTRTNDTRVWVDLVALDGTSRWSAEVSPFEPTEKLGVTGAAASGEHVVVLAHDPSDSPRREVAFALSRRDGTLLWQSTLDESAGSDGPGRLRHPMIVLDEERVYLIREIRGDGGPVERLDALSLEDGAPLWHLERTDDTLMLQLLESGELFVGAVLPREVPVVLDRSSGEVVRELAAANIRCFIPAGALGFDHERAIVIDERGERWQASPDPTWGFAWEGPCGARGDLLVLSGERRSHREHGLVGIDRSTGDAAWRISFGRRLPEPVVSLDGTLARFLPVVVAGAAEAGDPVRREVEIVDLEQGETVDRWNLDESAVAVATADRSWLWSPSRRVLIAFDPATGSSTTATRYAQIDGHDSRLDDDLHSGVLWMYGGGLARPGRLPWMAFDLSSGSVVHANGDVAAEDVTHAWLRPQN